MTTKTSRGLQTQKEILITNNFSTKSQNEFHWTDLVYDTSLSQFLR